jgi:hypothetical protein
MSRVLYRAAWVPDDDLGRDWDDAASLAASWVARQCARLGAGAILVTNTQDAAYHVPTLTAFARRYGQTTPRSRSARAAHGPVLAYLPTAQTLDYAMGLARGAALAVVEGRSFRVSGWADETGAVDLTRLGQDPALRDPRLSRALDSLTFYSGNAYGSALDRQQARQVLDDLHGRGLLDRDALVGAMAARGLSPAGMVRLNSLVDAAAGG